MGQKKIFVIYVWCDYNEDNELKHFKITETSVAKV